MELQLLTKQSHLLEQLLEEQQRAHEQLEQLERCITTRLTSSKEEKLEQTAERGSSKAAPMERSSSKVSARVDLFRTESRSALPAASRSESLLAELRSGQQKILGKIERMEKPSFGRRPTFSSNTDGTIATSDEVTVALRQLQQGQEQVLELLREAPRADGGRFRASFSKTESRVSCGELFTPHASPIREMIREASQKTNGEQVDWLSPMETPASLEGIPEDGTNFHLTYSDSAVDPGGWITAIDKNGWMYQHGCFNENARAREIVTSPIFEAVIAFIIIINAVTIGISAENSIAHAIKNPGTPEEAEGVVMMSMQYGFAFCYTAELLLKLWAFRVLFFIGPEWRWNAFDTLLVIFAFYDIFSGFVGSDTNVVKLLRLVKMLKMLRIVRVMRFFKELRTMLASIAGTVMALFWSFVMIGLMMYCFGLVFVQATAGYLMETPMDQIDTSTFDAIEQYWSSVLRSAISLFMAVTGGSDWEPLAEPFRAINMMYYFLFVFYIFFSIVSLLNVLTGMFVDAAVKIVEGDEQGVARTLIEGALKDVQLLKELLDDYDDGRPGTIAWKALQVNRKEPVLKDFLAKFKLTWDDMKKVFAQVQVQGRANTENFITVCQSAGTNNSKSMEMNALVMEVKQQSAMMRRHIKRMDEIFTAEKAAAGEAAAAAPDKGSWIGDAS